MIRMRIAAYVSHLSAPLASGRRSDRFDVLHAQDGIGANALASLRERSVIRGYVRTVHHVDHFDDPAIEALEARAIRRARNVVCVSEMWRQALAGDYGVSATVIRNGVNRRRFAALAALAAAGDLDVAAGDPRVARRLGLKPGAPLIVCVGGIEERKNTVRILQAFQRLRRRFPRAQLAVVGGASLLDHSCYRASFDAVLRASGLGAGAGRDVVITGPVRDADLPGVLRLADAVAFPSVREGFGLVALEALACGTPTVVSRIAPFTEYLSDGDVEWADPLDVESIAAALGSAVSRGKFAPPAVCARHGWGTCAVSHIALYRRFLDSQVSQIESQVSNRDSQVSHFDSQVLL